MNTCEKMHSDSPEDESPTTPPPPKKSHYFVIPLTIGYYTLVFPFKPVYDATSDRILLTTNKFQKPLCYASWSLSLLNRLTTFRLTLLKTSAHNPTSYFQLTHAILHVIPYVIYFHTITTSSTSISTLLNSIHKSTVIVQNSSRNTALRVLVIVTQSLWFVLMVASPVIGYEIINSSCWTPTTLISTYTTHGKYTSFLLNSPTPISPPSTPTDYIACILQILNLTSHVSLLFFIVSLFGNMCITLYSASSGFYNIIMKTYDQDVEAQSLQINMKSSYNDLKSITSSVNSTFYFLSFWYMIDLMAWLSTELDSGVRTNDYFVRIHILYYLVYVSVCLCFSAEAFRKIEKLHKFVKTEKNASALVNENVTTQDVDQITRCLKHDVVGIGEVGFFRINYSFIGQITGLIITFYIISVEDHTMDEKFGVVGC